MLRAPSLIIFTFTLSITQLAHMLATLPQNLGLPIAFTDVYNASSISTAVGTTQDLASPPNPYIYTDRRYIVRYELSGVNSFPYEDAYYFISQVFAALERERRSTGRQITDEISGNLLQFNGPSTGLQWSIDQQHGAREDLTYRLADMAVAAVWELLEKYRTSGIVRVRAYTFKLYGGVNIVATGELDKEYDNRITAA